MIQIQGWTAIGVASAMLALLSGILVSIFKYYLGKTSKQIGKIFDELKTMQVDMAKNYVTKDDLRWHQRENTEAHKEIWDELKKK